MAVRIYATLLNLGEFTMRAFSFDNFDMNIAKISEQFHAMEDHVKNMQNTLAEWNKDEEIQTLQNRLKQSYRNSLCMLSDKEKDSLRAFRDKHYEMCCGNGKYKSKGNTWIYTISGTGIGHIIKITCPECGQTEDVTDIDSW